VAEASSPAGPLEGMEALPYAAAKTCARSVSPTTRLASGRAAGRATGAYRFACFAVAMPTAYWTQLGLVPIGERVRRLREHWRTAGCGPACPVVWEGRSNTAPTRCTPGMGSSLKVKVL